MRRIIGVILLGFTLVVVASIATSGGCGEKAARVEETPASLQTLHDQWFGYYSEFVSGNTDVVAKMDGVALKIMGEWPQFVEGRPGAGFWEPNYMIKGDAIKEYLLQQK